MYKWFRRRWTLPLVIYVFLNKQAWWRNNQCDYWKRIMFRKIVNVRKISLILLAELLLLEQWITKRKQGQIQDTVICDKTMKMDDWQIPLVVFTYTQSRLSWFLQWNRTENAFCPMLPKMLLILQRKKLRKCYRMQCQCSGRQIKFRRI